MGRPRKGQQSTTVQVSFRLDAAMVAELDEIAAKETANTGYAVERTDVVKKALRDWLEARRPRKR